MKNITYTTVLLMGSVLSILSSPVLARGIGGDDGLGSCSRSKCDIVYHKATGTCNMKSPGYDLCPQFGTQSGDAIVLRFSPRLDGSRDSAVQCEETARLNGCNFLKCKAETATTCLLVQY